MTSKYCKDNFALTCGNKKASSLQLLAYVTNPNQSQKDLFND